MGQTFSHLTANDQDPEPSSPPTNRDTEPVPQTRANSGAIPSQRRRQRGRYTPYTTERQENRRTEDNNNNSNTTEDPGVRRERERTGNQLLSRIVSRSIISSISQELERRRLADTDQFNYMLDFTGRLELYYQVSVFILGVLESNNQQNRDDGGNGLQFRIFLLPGAIEQALEQHDSESSSSNASPVSASESATEEDEESSVNVNNRQTDDEEPQEERLRDEQRRRREEKLQRLRILAQAMNDPERRGIMVPIVVLGLRMGPEQAAGNSGDTRPAEQGNNGEEEEEDRGVLYEMLRGLRSRVNGIFSNPQEEESTTTERLGESTSASTEQPGLSVYITIHHINVGSPLVLPMAIYSLFPEILEEEGDGGGNHYDLFMEIASIIGQASATTVPQEVVDEKLAKYVYVDMALARLATDETETVELVSGERCPICLENFEANDMLRVLECHHALHLVCGDSWFTTGSNKCPMCRSKAIHIK